jgi:hypothetical protein
MEESLMDEHERNAWAGLEEAEERYELADSLFSQVEEPTTHQKAAHERQQAGVMVGIAALRFVLEATGHAAPPDAPNRQ